MQKGIGRRISAFSVGAMQDQGLPACRIVRWRKMSEADVRKRNRRKKKRTSDERTSVH
jgi:hypothetical protein